MVERIFIIEDDEKNLKNILNTLLIIKQIIYRNGYFKTYYVFNKILKEKRQNLLTEIGSGFIGFDHYAVSKDIYENGVIRGQLFLDDYFIKRCDYLFSSLRDYAVPLDIDFVLKHKSLLSDETKKYISSSEFTDYLDNDIVQNLVN
jgi:hypothetical protein